MLRKQVTSIGTAARLPLFSLLLIALCVGAAHAQDGRINGTVRSAAKTPVAGATVTAINQVTTRRATKRTDTGGAFSFQLRPGAYRILVSAPETQIFDRENVIVEPGQAATVEVELKAAAPAPKVADPAAAEQAAGYTGDGNIMSAAQTNPGRREVRDRWRLAFPEYDRYGDSGARGRDIPLRRGMWYNPYDLNLLKVDDPIFGQ